jgi:hypothetical protein
MTDAATSAAALSLRVLLRGVVDYAGLFPPASRGMEAAVTEYAAHRESAHAWALGRFVLPAARLDEFDIAAMERLPHEGAKSWALAALVASDLEEDIARIEEFNRRHSDARAGAVIVDTVELKAHSTRDVERAGELLDRRFGTYIEVPVSEDPAELIDAIGRTRARAKIRTGGVTPDAFPPSQQVVRFLARCLAHGVAFKATAGLHHPWRNEYRLSYSSDAPCGTMYGFLNVLLAVAALHGGLGEREATRVLEERDAESVQFDERGVTWRGVTFGGLALEAARESMLAFGSCSFTEPMTELQVLGLL